ncbi:MAG TPA: ribose 5-phosphate isomerase B [Elusimicrobiota bacterium]|nr:ribose 5-phosphate isomerase B [Elusimicrobiota bacterium]
MKVAIGFDHAGVRHKSAIAGYLRARGHRVLDKGTTGDDAVDYPDYARAVAESVRRGESDRGVLVCGSGVGMCIAANKVKGVRAALVWTPKVARLAAEHNHANVLCLAGRFFTSKEIVRMLGAWLGASYVPGRHARRVKKISAMEKGECGC